MTHLAPCVSVPADPALRSTIEQIARQCVANPAIEEMLQKASSGDKLQVLLKGKEFVVDLAHEGHQYFKWCVDSARKQTSQPALASGYPGPPAKDFSLGFQPSPPDLLQPSLYPPSSSFDDSSSQYDIHALVNAFQEPSLPTGDDSYDVPVLTATTASTLTSLLSPILSAFPSSVNLSSWIDAVWCIQPDTLRLLVSSPHRPSTKAWCLKKTVEASSDFWGRLSRAIVLYRLVLIDASMRDCLLSYLVWVLRLAYIIAQDDLHKNTVIELLKRARHVDHLIESDELFNQYAEVIRCKSLPSPPVDPVYNPENKRRSRFDLSSPSRAPSPKRLKSLEPPTQPPLPLQPILTPPMLAQFSLAQFPPMLGLPPSASFPSPWPALPNIQPAPPAGPPPSVTCSSRDVASSEIPLDPEKIPVGLLATMLKSISKRGRNIQAAFVPYRPLDPLLTPSSFPTPQPLTDYMVDRLNDLQDDIDLEFKKIEAEERRRPLEQLKNGSYDDVATNPDYDYGKPAKKERKKHPARGFRDDGGFTSRCEASWEKPLAWAQAEMGVEDDGTLLNGTTETRGKREERLGIGAAGVGGPGMKSAAQDIFNHYRKNKSKKYHQVIAAAQAGRWGVEEEKVCYICQKPGHFARECKFGMT